MSKFKKVSTHAHTLFIIKSTICVQSDDKVAASLQPYEQDFQLMDSPHIMSLWLGYWSYLLLASHSHLAISCEQSRYTYSKGNNDLIRQ